MRHGERLALIVRDIDGREPEFALDALQLEAHAFAQLRIEIGKRLVEQKEFGLHDQSAGEREALLLSAG